VSGDELIEAAIVIANVECKADKRGCGGPWCEAQHKIRQVLSGMGVEWQPSKDEPTKAKNASA